MLKLLIRINTAWHELSNLQRAIIELILDIASIGSLTWLLYYLSSPWWGYILAWVCVIVQKAIVDKKC